MSVDGAGIRPRGIASSGSELCHSLTMPLPVSCRRTTLLPTSFLCRRAVCIGRSTNVYSPVGYAASHCASIGSSPGINSGASATFNDHASIGLYRYCHLGITPYRYR